jgi:hypothetical protein
MATSAISPPPWLAGNASCCNVVGQQQRAALLNGWAQQEIDLVEYELTVRPPWVRVPLSLGVGH